MSKYQTPTDTRLSFSHKLKYWNWCIRLFFKAINGTEIYQTSQDIYDLLSNYDIMHQVFFNNGGTGDMRL